MPVNLALGAMRSSDSTWRGHPFEAGETYAARESFVGFNAGEFIAGHDYVFDGAAYSRYDSSTAFTFHERGKTTAVYWWWHDEQPDTLCQQRFELPDESNA